MQPHQSAGDLFRLLSFFAARTGRPSAVEAVRALSIDECAAAVEFVDYELPDTYVDGVPDGGSIRDEFLAVFGRPPFCHPPDVIGRQNPRDLLLILEAMQNDDD